MKDSKATVSKFKKSIFKLSKKHKDSNNIIESDITFDTSYSSLKLPNIPLVFNEEGYEDSSKANCNLSQC